MVLLLPQTPRIDIARFHKHTDADGYAQVVRRLNPEGNYVVVFDAWAEE